MDANGYYLYLPAIFIYDDLKSLRFTEKLSDQFDRTYFLYKNSSGGYMTKYSPGMAILELPFFLIAHFTANYFGFEANGYSPPYRLSIAISSIFYSCLGLWILSFLLARYFSKPTVNWVLLSLFLGTNLLFSSLIQAGVTHNYLFMVFSLLILFLDNWRISEEKYWFALSCACVGFSTLIRPTEVLVGIVPLVFFWYLRKPNFSLKSVRSNLFLLVYGLGAFLVFMVPVFFYWKFSTGSWIAYTYEDEGFYFDRPWQIWYGLFGFRKGWLVYTPMVTIAIFGLWRMLNSNLLKPYALAILIYLPSNLYIILSWYGWWYGGCFGNRALVPVLALLSLPLAWIFESSKSVFKNVLFAISVFFIVLNIFQSFQYQRQIMHMDAMTWESYKFIFGKWKLNDSEKAEMKQLLDYPDYSQRGKRLNEYFK